MKKKYEWTSFRKTLVAVQLLGVLFGIFWMITISTSASINQVELVSKKEVQLMNYTIQVPYIVMNCTWVPQNNSYNKCGLVRDEIKFYDHTVRTWQELKFQRKSIDVSDLGYYCWNTATGISCVSSSDGAGNIKAQVIKEGMTYFSIDTRTGKVIGSGFKQTKNVKMLREELE